MLSSARVAQLGLAAVAVVFLACIGVLAHSAAQHAGQGIVLAPHFSLVSADGDRISLGSLQGKVVVLFFCSMDSPVGNDYARRFARLADRYADSPDVRVLMIDPDLRPGDPQAAQRVRMQKFVTGQHFPVLPDPRHAVSSAYGVTATPTVAIIDPLGRLRYRGAFDDNPDERHVTRHCCQDALQALAGAGSPQTDHTQSFDWPVAQSK